MVSDHGHDDTGCDYRLGADGIAVLSVRPGGAAGEALADAVARLAAATPLRGLIVQPAAVSGDGDRAASRALGAALQALEQVPVPRVAVLAESALGDACAVALACHHRIALARDTLRIGLPATAAGGFPGAGACVRLVRLLGIETAFPLLLEGATPTAAEALALGWIDALAVDGACLQKAARAWIAANPEAAPRWSSKPLFTSGNPLHLTAPAPALLNWVQAAPARLALTHAGRVPAAARALLAAAVESLQVDFATALVVEARYDLALRNGAL